MVDIVQSKILFENVFMMREIILSQRFRYVNRIHQIVQRKRFQLTSELLAVFRFHHINFYFSIHILFLPLPHTDLLDD